MESKLPHLNNQVLVYSYYCIIESPAQGEQQLLLCHAPLGSAIVHKANNFLR